MVKKTSVCCYGKHDAMCCYGKHDLPCVAMVEMTLCCYGGNDLVLLWLQEVHGAWKSTWPWLCWITGKRYPRSGADWCQNTSRPGPSTTQRNLALNRYIDLHLIVVLFCHGDLCCHGVDTVLTLCWPVISWCWPMLQWCWPMFLWCWPVFS